MTEARNGPFFHFLSYGTESDNIIHNMETQVVINTTESTERYGDPKVQLLQKQL